MHISSLENLEENHQKHHWKERNLAHSTQRATDSPGRSEGREDRGPRGRNARRGVLEREGGGGGRWRDRQRGDTGGAGGYRDRQRGDTGGSVAKGEKRTDSAETLDAGQRDRQRGDTEGRAARQTDRQRGDRQGEETDSVAPQT